MVPPKKAKAPNIPFDVSAISERVFEMTRDGKRFAVIEAYPDGDALLAIYDERIRVRLADGTVVK